MLRWWSHIETLPLTKKAIESFNDARKEMERSKKVKRTESVEVVLPNAVVGKVVVRFGTSYSTGTAPFHRNWIKRKAGELVGD